MTFVHLLSDTVYPQQAVRQLHQLLNGANEFPVKAAQIYGLRQIARQEFGRIGEFARHQEQRAQSKYEAEAGRRNPRDSVLQSLQAEINFWTLVDNFCGDSSNHWSVRREGYCYLPSELRDENRRKVPGKTPQETTQNQQYNNRLKSGQREWFQKWENDHIPAFFERFCTYCLYCIAKAEMGQLGSINTDETDQLLQPEQNSSQDEGAMQTALQQANLIE